MEFDKLFNSCGIAINSYRYAAVAFNRLLFYRGEVAFFINGEGHLGFAVNDNAYDVIRLFPLGIGQKRSCFLACFGVGCYHKDIDLAAVIELVEEVIRG